VPEPVEPSDRDTGQEDSTIGGGRRPAFAWLLGLIAVAAVLAVVSIVLGAADGSPPPSR
jgi:hypothetical protein